MLPIAHCRRSPARSLSVGATVGLLLLTSAAPASAIPVQVRARTRLKVEPVLEGSTLRLKGQLTTAQDRPVAGAEVTLEVKGVGTVRTATRADGSFDGSAPIPLGVDLPSNLQITGRFPGDSRHGDAKVESQEPLGALPLELTLGATPSIIARDRPQVLVIAAVGSGGRPLPGAVVGLEIGEKQLPPAQTGPDGRAQVALSPRTLGPPGVLPLRAVVAPRPPYRGAEAQATLTLTDPVRVTLETAQDDGTDVRLVGTVQSLEGPVLAASVSIYAGATLIGHASTDERGQFRVRLATDALSRAAASEEPSSRDLTVIAVAEAPGRGADRGVSPPVSVRVPDPAQMPGWLLAAPLGLLALWAAARLLIRLVRERRGAARQEAQLAGLPQQVLTAEGERAGPPDRVAGRLWDAERRAPLVNAQVSLALAAQTHALSVDARGQFDSGPLPPGAFQLTVEARGCEPVVLSGQVPHDGIFGACVITPPSYRAGVRLLFARLVRARTRQPFEWGRETPRQAEPWLSERFRRDLGGVRALTGSVEEAVFGPEGGPQEAARVHEHVDHLERRHDAS